MRIEIYYVYDNEEELEKFKDLTDKVTEDLNQTIFESVLSSGEDPFEIEHVFFDSVDSLNAILNNKED